MLGTAIIVFREVFEAALIVSIVAAATRGLSYRFRLLGGGVAAGVLAAILVAASADVIANLASGMGQELFNAAVLFAAVLLISWHVLWMSKHGREMAQHLGEVSAAVKSGSRPATALLFVIAIAILREGSEVVLFLYGLAAGGSSTASLATGSAVGLAGGIVAGAALYLGLLRIPPGRMFSATNDLLTLVAAGMAATGTHFLIQADLLPALRSPLWDTSAIIENGSLPGKTLHALIGYDARPTGTQMLVFALVLIGVGIASRMINRPHPAAQRKPAPQPGRNHVGA